MPVHRHVCFSLVAFALIAPLAHAQGTPAPAAAPPPPAVPAAPAAPAPAAPAAPAPAAPAAPAAAPAPAPAAPAGPPPGPQQGPPIPYYQEQSAETPHIYVEQPPLPPTPPRNRYFHDGFYLRLAAGYGYLGASSSVNHSDSTASLSAGSGVAFDFMVGGTPAPGVAVGGALQLQGAFNPTSSVTQHGSPVYGLDNGASGSVSFAMIGPMIDAFPIPTGGFHLGSMLGLAELGLKSRNNNVSGGFGASVWTGYMWWASSQWSMGLMARFSMAWTYRAVGTEADPFDATDMSTALGIMLSAAYH